MKPKKGQIQLKRDKCLLLVNFRTYKYAGYILLNVSVIILKQRQGQARCVSKDIVGHNLVVKEH